MLVVFKALRGNGVRWEAIGGTGMLSIVEEGRKLSRELGGYSGWSWETIEGAGRQ